MVSEKDDKSGRNSKLLLTRIVPADVVLILGGLGVFLLVKPKHEQQVTIPPGLDEAIKTYFTSEKRSIKNITVFHCDRTRIGNEIAERPAYAAIVQLEPSQNRIDEMLGYSGYQVIGFEKDGKWLIFPHRGLKFEQFDTDHPCDRK